MIGKREQNDKAFTPDDYDGFYEHHYFAPIPDEHALNVHQVIPRFGWAYDQVASLKPKSLLDLGCLDGSFPITIASHFDIPTVGVDLTKDGIDLAKERAKANGLKATFYQGSVEKWLQKFIDQKKKFDMITFFEIIEHVEDVQFCLGLIDKVLAPGGSVLVSTPEFEGPNFGYSDTLNTCHVRLYTTKDEDYEKTFRDKHHNNIEVTRKATSITKEIGKDRIKEMGVYSELINLRYSNG